MTVFKKILAGNSSESQKRGVTPLSVPLLFPSHAGPKAVDEFAVAERHLTAAERLLLDPTPASIRETRIFLEEASALVDRYHKQSRGSGPVPEDVRLRIAQYAQTCLRVQKLLEGALRVQWIRMHWIAALTQTYTRAAKTKSWRPASTTLNIEM